MDELDSTGTLPAMHPGEVLREEFMIPLGLTAGKIARACGIPRNRIEMISRETLGISGDTALRLGRFFGTSAELWLNLQKRYELQTARAAIGDRLEAVQKLTSAAIPVGAKRRAGIPAILDSRLGCADPE